MRCLENFIDISISYLINIIICVLSFLILENIFNGESQRLHVRLCCFPRGSIEREKCW